MCRDANKIGVAMGLDKAWTSSSDPTCIEMTSDKCRASDNTARATSATLVRKSNADSTCTDLSVNECIDENGSPKSIGTTYG